MAYVLFDCDGTACDSEALAMPIASESLVQIAKDQGVALPDGYVVGLFGKSIGEMVHLLERDYSVKFRGDEEEAIHQETVRILSLRTQETPGMAMYLTAVQEMEKTPVVVTSSKLDRVLGALESSDLRRFFKDEHIFSAISTLPVPTPKPSPAIYNYALDKLRIRPEDTHTYEDSGSGVLSSQGAHVPCYAYVGGGHVREIQKEHGEKLVTIGAQRVFKSWDEAMDTLVPQEIARKVRKTFSRAATYG